jgi:hypothetical protein
MDGRGRRNPTSTPPSHLSLFVAAHGIFPPPLPPFQRKTPVGLPGFGDQDLRVRVSARRDKGEKRRRNHTLARLELTPSDAWKVRRRNQGWAIRQAVKKQKKRNKKKFRRLPPYRRIHRTEPRISGLQNSGRRSERRRQADRCALRGRCRHRRPNTGHSIFVRLLAGCFTFACGRINRKAARTDRAAGVLAAGIHLGGRGTCCALRGRQQAVRADGTSAGWRPGMVTSRVGDRRLSTARRGRMPRADQDRIEGSRTVLRCPSEPSSFVLGRPRWRSPPRC